jgi:hypothetical protein
VALFALCAIAATAPTAHAYRLGGKRWPGSTITYYNGTPYKAEVRTAVRTWNASGMKIRFKAASRAKARVQIRYGGRPGCYGRAQLGFARGRRATVHLGKNCTRSSSMAGVATHELGHILSLNHEDRSCAAMNTVIGQACGARPPWSYLCRYLEPDDVAGAVRRYGGVAKPIGGTQYCALFAPPQAPAGLTLAYVVAAGTVATATIPEPARLSADESPVIWSQLLLWRYPNVCPPDAGAGAPQAIRNTGYGPQSIPIDASPPRGTWCYAVALIDGLGRRTVASAANVTVP